MYRRQTTWGERLLGIKEWEEYDVEDTVESRVCWQKYVIYD